MCKRPQEVISLEIEQNILEKRNIKIIFIANFIDITGDF